VKVLTIFGGVALAGYVVARAVLVPLTYDEAATYLRYIPQDFLSVFNFEVATNHFLNTLATRLATSVAGDGELVLRLASLAGYALYLCFSMLLVRQIPQRTIAIAGFVLLHLNPYLLDFFALSRGYGLSIGLLFGALYFLHRFASQRQTRAAGRDISRALMFGCGAVLASFGVLNAYLGIVAVVLAIGFVHRRSGAAAPRSSRLRVLALPVIAAVFTFLVLSQDHGLTHRFYEPVTVAFVGLDEVELDAVTVSRINMRRRPEGVARQAGASIWRVDPPVAVRALRIEMPYSAAEKLGDGRASVEVIVGNRLFARPREHESLWTEHGAGSRVMFESRDTVSLSRSRTPRYEPVANWRGDRNHLRWVAIYTVGALALLGALAAVLAVTGSLLSRRGIMMSAEVWHPLTRGLLWLVALAGPPLYVLRRSGELYYGGISGFVVDTIYSLIVSSSYGQEYVAGQSDIVFAVIVSVGAASAIASFLWIRRRNPQPIVAAWCFLAVLAVAAAAVIVQNRLLDTPFLIARTALFFIPLFVLFAVFLLGAIASLGEWGRRLAVSIAVASATIAAAHFAVTANVSYALDWRPDAATREMIGDLADIVAAERPGSQVVLGVDWHYSAVAAYYAQKGRTAEIEVHTIPATRDLDFSYVGEQNVGSWAVIKRYPLVNSVLARAPPR
jgi:hypothetical protein